jgi:hypothetical protein
VPDGISIDQRGEIISELGARVVRDENGKPRFEPLPGQAARWNAVLLRHADKGPLRLAISRVSQRRSYAQNRLLWHVYGQVLAQLRETAAEVGERCPFRTDEELHDAMKHVLIGPTVMRFKGTELEIPPTSTTLTVEQFSAFISGVVGFWSKRGIYVEMPEAS